MADLSDVENALVQLVASLVYPNGTAQPSVANAACMVYAGWPVPAQLDADLAAGKTHITVYSRAEEKNTTRYMETWCETMPPASIRAAINGQALTLNGSPSTIAQSENVMAMIGGKPYVVTAHASDTLNGLAVSLGALIMADVPAVSVSGAVITLPAGVQWQAARIGVTGTLAAEVRRQEKTFQLTIWTDTPDKRNAFAKALDSGMASMRFLQLADGSYGRLIYKSSVASDDLQKVRLFKRDFLYTVEYGTIASVNATEVTQEQLNTTVQPDGVVGYLPVSIRYY